MGAERQRRAGRWVAVFVAAALLTCCAGVAQDADGAGASAGAEETQQQSELMGALQQGPLVVWVVRPPVAKMPTVPGQQLYRSPVPGYHEQTTGSFGQDASSVGQSAASYGVDANSAAIAAPSSPTVSRSDPSANTPAGAGYAEQTAGSYGQTSGSFGTAASNHGQAASTLGQTASTAGQTAGSYGQTAGSFGNSLSTIAQAGTNDKSSQSGDADPLRDLLRSLLRSDFPQLTVVTRGVPADELGDDLRATKGTAGFPDVLVGALPVAWAQGLQNEFGLALLPLAGFYEDGVTDDQPFAPEFAVLAGAPHGKAARAFALWIAEAGESCEGCVAEGLSREKQAVAAVALDAVTHLMRGDGLGDEGDPAMAPFPPNLGRIILLTNENRLASDSSAKPDVVEASVNGKLATVTMRVVASSDRVFGVAHPLVVLRKGDDGKWRVLHVSLNLPAVEAESEREALMERCTGTICGTAGVVGVSLAAPANGDTRQPLPELWWDNGGGSRLEVVEWQMAYSSEWTDARLFLVPDRGAKLRTQVTAGFASRLGRYRWRVWSVGQGGALKLSPWRTMVIAR